MSNAAEALNIQGYETIDHNFGTGISGQADKTSPFPRINAWRDRFMATSLSVSADRAVLWTEKMKTNENKPYIIRCAEAFANVMENVPIQIGPYELLLGNMAAPPRSAPFFPEFPMNSWSTRWITNRLNSARATDS